MTYPRAFAISETTWLPARSKEWENFVKRLESNFERFYAAGINYAPSIYDPIVEVTKNAAGQLTIDVTTQCKTWIFFIRSTTAFPTNTIPNTKGMIIMPNDADMFRVLTHRNNKRIVRLISIKTEDLVKRIKK